MTDKVENNNPTSPPFSAEELFRFMIESVKDYAIFATDPAGYIVTWNTGAERIFGYSEAEALGQHNAIIFTPEDRERGAMEDELATAAREGRAEDDRWHLRKDGSRFFASGVMAPLRSETGTLRGFIKVARDVTESNQAQADLRRAHNELEERVQKRTQELQASQQALRDTMRRLVATQEEERRRIARDIHDHLGQQLTALKLHLSLLRIESNGNEQLDAKLEQLATMLNRLDEETDFLAWELRPAALDALGLRATLANYVKEWSEHFQITADFHCSNLQEGDLTPEAETCLYRIAQEALNNVTKHAQAQHVATLLERRDGHAALIVEDDGHGFNPHQTVTGEKGLGLVGMRERAALVGGTLEIESGPDHGTTIFVRVPVVSSPKLA